MIDRALVLAAGEGTRLRPLTKHRPKPMLPAGTSPILEHVFDALIEGGIADLHVVVGYEADRVRSYFGPSYRGVPVTYHRQKTQLGSGDAVLAGESAIDTDTLVVNGDQLFDPSLVEAVIETHDPTEAIATLGLVESEHAPSYGAVSLENSQVIELIEKPSGDRYRLLNAGVYALSPEVIAALEDTDRTDGELALTTTLADLVGSDHLVRGVTVEGRWKDATYPWDLIVLTRTVLDSREARITVHDDATVHDSTVLRGPVAIGADAVVGPNTTVGPSTAIGRNCTVESNVTIEHSLIDADCRIGSGSALLEAVMGAGVSIGPGTVIPGGPSDLPIDDVYHRDIDLGAVVADRVSFGGGVTVTPGTLVGPNVSVSSGTTIGGVYDEGSIVDR